jgi:MoaA/NifB/PqqE/SkfB family radical SAM enzyme
MERFTNDLMNKVIHKTIDFIPFRCGEIKELLTLVLGVIKYLTPLKLYNLIVRESERLKRVDLPKGFPFHTLIDIANTCNLKCPYCPTGRRQNSGRTQRIIDIDLLEAFLDQIGKYLIMADLFNWGEPLLHPHIENIVRMFHKRNIFQQISSNLNIRNKHVLEKVCDAGLDFLIVSISGITQEIYEKYHQGGDIDLVWDNLRYIISYKKKSKYFNPIIELKYLIFKYNTHQIEKARILAKKIGVDIFRVCYAGGPEDEIISVNEEKKNLLYPGRGNLCSQLWSTIVLNSDGGIAPCCFLYFRDDDFAEFSQSNNFNIKDIMSNQKYVAARRMFKDSAVGALPKELQHPCLKCVFVHRQPHLTGYLAANPYAKKAHRTGGP